MTTFSATLGNEKGSVLVVGMLIMVLLTVIGIAATTTTSIEVNIAGNNRWYQVAFYAAEGGTETGIELVEQNIEVAGFDDNGEGEFELGDVRGTNLEFYMNPVPDPANLTPDAYFPGNYLDYSADAAHTNLTFGQSSGLSVGGAIQMAAGYEGKGKAAAGGGAFMLYDIYSDRQGDGNAEAVVRLQWMHVM